MAIRRGFTLVEMVIVIAVLAILAAVATPRLTMSAGMRSRGAARQVVLDLELARTKALASKRIARLVFDTAGGTYTGYPTPTATRCSPTVPRSPPRSAAAGSEAFPAGLCSDGARRPPCQVTHSKRP